MDTSGWITVAAISVFGGAAGLVALLVQFFKPLWDRWVDRYTGLGTNYQAFLTAAAVVYAAAASTHLFANLTAFQLVVLLIGNAVALAIAASGWYEIFVRKLMPPDPAPTPAPTSASSPDAK